MKRTLLLVLALAGCGDDAPGDDDQPNVPTPTPTDASRADATPDAARDRMDATVEAGQAPDASEPAPDASLVDAASFDAQVVDTGVDAGADAGSCSPEGERCDVRACCDGASCVTSSAAPYPVCAPKCVEPSECESGCCTDLPGSGADKVCAPQLHCDDDQPDPTAPLTGINCYNDLNVYDNWGEYMGKATSKFFEAEGVCNSSGEYGKFGSNPNNLWSITSDAYSSTLAFSAVLGCGSDFPVLAYVSKYTGNADKRVIDPDNLCQVLENSNL